MVTNAKMVPKNMRSRTIKREINSSNVADIAPRRFLNNLYERKKTVAAAIPNKKSNNLLGGKT